MLMQHKMHFGRRSPHQPNPQQNHQLRQRKAQKQRQNDVMMRKRRISVRRPCCQEQRSDPG
jgi:hypothetical protein